MNDYEPTESKIEVILGILALLGIIAGLLTIGWMLGEIPYRG